MQDPNKSWRIQWETPTSKGFYPGLRTKNRAKAIAKRLNKTASHATLSFSAVNTKAAQ